jgi:secondary thiamine-phosphate synthase enzyme
LIGLAWFSFFIFPLLIFHSHMAAHSEAFEVRTRGKGTFEISDEVAAIVGRAGIRTGTVTVFVRHTSASLVIMENADPSARRDLEVFFDKLVPEDTPWFVHTLEGPDDMPSHIRMALTRTSEVIPIVNGRMALGTWQGIFLFEHRRAPHRREIVVSVVGE